MGDRVEEGLYLSWMGGPDLDHWREDLMERFVLDGTSEERIEELKEMTNDEFLHEHFEWYNEDARFEWECLLGELDTLIKKFSGYWWVEVTSFGWQALSGHQEFTAEDGQTFLQKLLPQTDCHFKIYYDDDMDIPNWLSENVKKLKGLRIQNFHHDSPTGREWYYALDVGDLIQCSECEKFFPEGDYYEHTWEDEYGPCVEHDENLCAACGKQYYEEDDIDTDA